MHHAIARAQQLNRHFAGADVAFLQGRVSNPSKRDTGGQNAEGTEEDGLWGGTQPPPQKFFVFLISKW